MRMNEATHNRLDLPETRSEIDLRIEELQKKRRENAAKGFARMAEQNELTELLKKRKEARLNG
jgi:hypothetical protein